MTTHTKSKMIKESADLLIKNVTAKEIDYDFSYYLNCHTTWNVNLREMKVQWGKR